MQRLVNGALIDVPAAEATAISAEWASFTPSSAPTYADATLGVALPLDEASQGEITAQGTAAGIALSLNGGTPPAGKTYLFPTADGRGYVAPDALTAYNLADRCRQYVEAARKVALGIV